MSVVRYRNHEVDICSSCKGIWIDADEIKPIIHRFSAQPDDKGKRADVAASSAQAPSAWQTVGDGTLWFPYELLDGVGEIVYYGADAAADIGGAILEIIVGVVSSS